MFAVSIYPYPDSGDQKTYYFTDRNEAEAFARYVNENDPDDFFNGCTGPLAVVEVEPVPYHVARRDFDEMRGDR